MEIITMLIWYWTMFIKFMSLETVDDTWVVDLKITLLPPTTSKITVTAYS